MRKKLTLWDVLKSLHGQRCRLGRTATGLAASVVVLMVAFLLPPDLDAQTVSPGSIVLDPSAACGGGSDHVDNVCITLPDEATCNVVDVFLLFDDTGSFTSNAITTGEVFGGIVTDLTTMLPGVNFAFGVGRFEDFGGPGSDFGSSLLNRPFILNQALLEEGSANFSSALADALSSAGTGPGSGGDSPETAIEALFQTATGIGFNGDPASNSSVRDSGLAGDPATWTNPGSSGDVPDFASYVSTKEKSGELGGAGWRAESCLRLVVLATDVCTVAPFAADAPIPDSIVGTGATVASTAFSCSDANRFGFVSDAESQATNSVADAVAPVGAATVPDTVQALNNLGIRVIGLGPGAGPTASTSPSTQPSTFLSALARLTGAVDGLGDPLVFDLGSDPSDIQAAIVGAVETSVKTPIDIELVPDPAIPGLTVTASPPIQENVGPGEEACFSVTFEGDETFEGGDLGLTFVNTASNGSLGMTVPADLRCPGCFDLVTRKLLCEADETGFSGSFEWTFIIRNRTSEDISHLFFVDLPPGVTVNPQHVTFSTPIPPNAPRLVTVRIDGATPGTVLDFRMTLHDAAIDECCVKRVELELPACDCAQLRVDSNPSCFSRPFTPMPPWRYTFDLENLTTVPVDYLLLAPVSPTDMTPISPADLVIDPNIVLLGSTLGGGDETGPISVGISGPDAIPGEEVCFRVSTHDTNFRQCCSIVKCLTIPDCFLGPVDFEPLGSAVLTRSADGLIVSDLDPGGESGVAATFGPARSAEISLQDFSVGVSLAEGAFVRFAVSGAVEGQGQEEEVVNLVATLDQGQVQIAPDGGAPSVESVLILRGGEVVASGEQIGGVVAVDGDWPTRFVMEENLGGIAWAAPIRLSLEEGGEILGDRVHFLFEGAQPVEGLTGSKLTAAAVGVMVIKGIDLEPAEEVPTP